MADLGRWLRGDYRIAAGTPSSDLGENEADADSTTA